MFCLRFVKKAKARLEGKGRGMFSTLSDGS